MPKITLEDVGPGYQSAAVKNANNTLIEDALNNDVLYRNNPAGEPNQMNNDLDMNSFAILNAGTSDSASSLVTRQDLADMAVTIGESPVLEDIANATTFTESSGSDVTPTTAYAQSYIRFTAATPTAFNVPLNATVSYIEGTELHIRQAGAGRVTISPAVGVTVNTPYEGTLILAGQGSTVTLKYIGSDEWDLMGQVRAV